MQLEEITLYHLQRAVDLYLQRAYPDGNPPDRLPRPQGDPDEPLLGHLDQFLDESGTGEGSGHCYALRLGNRDYPFMKLRLQEVLFKNEYFFTVDTHDQMFESQDDPKLAQLMAFNRELQQEIEAAWEGAGLPTTCYLQGLTASEPVAPAPSNGRCILLVDDSIAIQDTIRQMLELRGYEVDLASDGQEALELADPARHALILMDVEMPRMDGFEACMTLKDDPDRRGIPILLATAGAVELARKAAPDGYLVKPFRAEALFKFLDTMLRDDRCRVS